MYQHWRRDVFIIEPFKGKQVSSDLKTAFQVSKVSLSWHMLAFGGMRFFLNWHEIFRLRAANLISLSGPCVLPSLKLPLVLYPVPGAMPKLSQASWLMEWKKPPFPDYAGQPALLTQCWCLPLCPSHQARKQRQPWRMLAHALCGSSLMIHSTGRRKSGQRL